MARPGIGGDRHDPCLLRRVGVAPHPARIGGSGGDPDPRPFRKGGGLHGRRLRSRQAPARSVHGAIGRCGKPRFRVAGSLSRAQPGDCADRAQGTVLSAPQRLPGNCPRPTLRRGDEVLDTGRFDERAAAPATARLAACLGRHAASDPPRFLRAAGRRDRARRDFGAADHRSRSTANPGASADRRPAPSLH